MTYEIDNEGFFKAARGARQKGDDIIAASPTIPADGTTLAHRIVIRDQGDQFVVHMQIFEGDRSYFEHGHYFPKRRGADTLPEHDRVELRKAWGKFEQRSRRILGMEDDLTNFRRATDVAEEIIKALLPEEDEERQDIINNDYMLESNLETFEHYSGKTLWSIASGQGDDEGGE